MRGKGAKKRGQRQALDQMLSADKRQLTDSVAQTEILFFYVSKGVKKQKKKFGVCVNYIRHKNVNKGV